MAESIEDDTLQKIAAENNLSETAFSVKKGNDDYDLRWFTPKSEIDLCGHATLASAYVIFQYLDQSVTNVKFHTLSERPWQEAERNIPGKRLPGDI